MNKTQEMEYIKDMIKNLNVAINNANQFGDTQTVEAINNQIQMLQKRLEEIK